MFNLMRTNRCQHIKILRKRLRHAARIVDAHRHSAQRHQRKTHRHAVIVVGVYLGVRR